MRINVTGFHKAEVIFTNTYKANPKPRIALFLKGYFREEEMSRMLISKITYLFHVPASYQRGDSIIVPLFPNEQIINVVGEMIPVFSTVMHLLELHQKTA